MFEFEMLDSGAESDSNELDELPVEPSKKFWLFFALQHSKVARWSKLKFD